MRLIEIAGSNFMICYVNLFAINKHKEREREEIGLILRFY